MFAGIVLSYIMINNAIDQKPLISKTELNVIKELNTLIPQHSFLMATDSYYSPWLYGYSGRDVIAPGLFSHNKWTRRQWENFWFGSKESRNQLLDQYDRPVYLYIGERQKPVKLSDDYNFKKITNRLWLYDPVIDD